MCWCKVMWSQADLGYLRHLSQHRLRTEHQAYLDRLEGKLPVDSLIYYRLKLALQYRDRTLFEANAPATNKVFLSDSSAMLLTALWYLEDEQRPVYQHMRWLQSTAFPSVQQVAAVFAANEENALHAGGEQWPAAMQENGIKLAKYSSKKPWKAALLSAVLPGSGKWYAGRPNSAMVNTLGLGLFALQAVEAYRKLGPQHPLTIGNMVVFGIFYGGNIAGSAKAVRVRRTELRNLFYKDAAFHYRRLHRPLLY